MTPLLFSGSQLPEAESLEPSDTSNDGEPPSTPLPRAAPLCTVVLAQMNPKESHQKLRLCLSSARRAASPPKAVFEPLNAPPAALREPPQRSGGPRQIKTCW